MEKLTRLVASVEASPFQAIVYGDLGTPEELCMALKGDTLWISEFLLVDCRIETPPAKPDCSRILVLINPKPGVFSYYPRFPHLSVIYLSDPVYDQVRLAKLTKGASVNRLIRMIHIPRPSKSQLVSILVNKPLFAGCTRPLLDYTMDVLVQIFFHATRDVNTLYRQARIIIPIAEDIFYGSDEYTLKDVYSELSVRIRNLYLDYGRYSPAAPGEPGSLGESLPTMTKFLIIASYLASTVPPEKDVQLFSTASTQRKKAKKVSQKASREFVGLSWFPLPRLLAIFKAICKGMLCVFIISKHSSM